MQPEGRGHRAIDAGRNFFVPPNVFQDVSFYPGFVGRPDDREDVMNRYATTRIMTGGLAALLLTFAAFRRPLRWRRMRPRPTRNSWASTNSTSASMGGGTRIFEFYVKDNAFWIEYGFTSPGELSPWNSTVDQFTFTDPDDGLDQGHLPEGWRRELHDMPGRGRFIGAGHRRK